MTSRVANRWIRFFGVEKMVEEKRRVATRGKGGFLE